MLWRDSDGQRCYTWTSEPFVPQLSHAESLLVYTQKCIYPLASKLPSLKQHYICTWLEDVCDNGVLCPFHATKEQLGIWGSKLHFAGCLGANPCTMDVKCSEEVTKHTLLWNSDGLTPHQAVKDLCCLQNICSILHYRTEVPQQESIMRCLQTWWYSCFQN